MLEIRALVSFLPAIAFSFVAAAQQQTLNQEALSTIQEFATEFCGDFLEGGSSKSISVSGEAQAEFSVLFKKLADLGVSGAGSINTEEYVGVLREDLAAELHDVRECKLALLESLRDTVIHKSVKAPPPAPQLIVKEGIRLWNEDTYQIQLAPNDMHEINGMQLFETLIGFPEMSCAGPGFVVYSWQVRDPYPVGGAVTIRRTPLGGLEETIATGASGQLNLGWCQVHKIKNTSINEVTVQIRHASAGDE